MNLPLRPNVPNQVCTNQVTEAEMRELEKTVTYCKTLQFKRFVFFFFLFFPLLSQGTINAQMLAQRQREMLSNHLRQRQRSMSMRPQGLNVPSNMAAGAMGGAQIAHANPTHFPYTANYGTSLPLRIIL